MDWVNALQKLFKTYVVEFLAANDLSEEARERGITKEMSESLEAAVITTAQKYLTPEARTRMGLDQTQVSVADLIFLMLGRYMDRSDERQDELRRVADKIKMRRNRSVIAYVTKHRRLRKDMMNEGCTEILNDVYEKVTMSNILNGLKNDPDWAPFRSTYKMFRKIKEQEGINALEDLMMEDERERRVKQEQADTARWAFLQNRAGRNSDKNRSKGKRDVSDSDDRSNAGNRWGSRNRYRQQTGTTTEAIRQAENHTMAGTERTGETAGAPTTNETTSTSDATVNSRKITATREADPTAIGRREITTT